MSLAPILLFVYNRPMHTRQLIQSLLANVLSEQSTLIVYSDGAKSPEDELAVGQVRELVRNLHGFAEVQVVERAENWGLAANIIDGVTRQVQRFGKVIVLEDDLVLSPYFLQFMNDALTVYEDEPMVGHIQACDFTHDPSLPETFLVKWTGSWGWATWQRAWQHFNPDGKALLHELEKRCLTRQFDFDGAYGFTRMLRHQVQGKNNSWAIRWNASLFLKNILSLNVGRTLVSNEGFDGSGTHCGSDISYSAKVHPHRIVVQKISPIAESAEGRKAIENFYRRTNSFGAKAVRRLKRILRGDFGR